MIKWFKKLFSGNGEDKRKLVLIVDDDEYIADLLRMHLESRGFATMRAANGVDALKRLAERVPDIMLLDITMPQMSGFEVLQIIREDERLFSLPVLMVTDVSLIGKVDECYSLGAKGYILKPFELEKVMQKIDSVLV